MKERGGEKWKWECEKVMSKRKIFSPDSVAMNKGVCPVNVQ